MQKNARSINGKSLWPDTLRCFFMVLKTPAGYDLIQENNNNLLVGGFNPSEKHYSQIEAVPQVEVKTKHDWNHHVVFATTN